MDVLRNLSQPWDIVPYKAQHGCKRVAVTEYPTENSPAVYALFVNLKIIRHLIALFLQNALEFR